MIPELEVQQTDNQDMELSQQNAKKFVKVLEDNPLLDGQFLGAVEFTAAALTIDINHGLGRMQRGWVMTDITSTVAAPLIYRTADWNDKTLTLTASLACEIGLWVF